MDFDAFKEKYASTMMCYQIMEHDIKFIYAYMLKGNTDKNLDKIDDKTLGTMIRMLEKLDYSDNKPFINRKDYSFLKRICDKRNYWAHQAFVDFLYFDNPFNTKEYIETCKKLEEDYEEVKRASSILETMRVEFCEKHRR